MPTNRTRTTRTRSGGAAEIANAAHFYFTIARLCGNDRYPETRPGFGQGKKDAELLRYWQANEADLLKAGLELMRTRNKPGQRPRDYFILLEKKHRRHAEEPDLDFLTRLKLLEPWEKAALTD